MIFTCFVSAFFLGVDAADKLDRPNPTPAAWFEAAVTVLLVVIGGVAAIRREGK